MQDEFSRRRVIRRVDPDQLLAALRSLDVPDLDGTARLEHVGMDHRLGVVELVLSSQRYAVVRPGEEPPRFGIGDVLPAWARDPSTWSGCAGADGAYRLIEGEAGELVNRTAARALQVADSTGEAVELWHNDRRVLVNPGDELDAILDRWAALAPERS